jgi:purine-binding chemotaxis protein CheW
MNVVVRTEDGPVSVLVDETGGVVEVPVDRLEPPPRTVGARGRDLLVGIRKLDHELLLTLDIERTATLAAS